MDVEKLTLENQHLVSVLEALSNKNKELLKFKSKLEQERSMHKKTTQEKHELQEALNIAKGYQQTALDLEREKFDILKQLEGLKEQVSVANNALYTQKGNGELVQEVEHLTEENRNLHKECAMHAQEKRELKAQYMSSQSQPSQSSRQSGMSAKNHARGQRISRLATIPDTSPPVPQKSSPSNRMQAIDHTHSMMGWRDASTGRLSGESEHSEMQKKRKRHDKSSTVFGHPRSSDRAGFEHIRANDQNTPVSDQRRSIPTAQPAAAYDLDPTLPCTFAESVDLTQMSDQTSPTGSIGIDGPLVNSLLRGTPLGTNSNERKIERSKRYPVPLDSLGSSQEAREVDQETLGNTRCEPTTRTELNIPDRGWNTRVDENLHVDITESDCRQEFPDVQCDRMDIAPGRTGVDGNNQGDTSNTAMRRGGFKYQEVVRRRADRDDMPGFDCADCKAFYDALATWGHVHDAPACGHTIKQGTADKKISIVYWLYTEY